MDSKNVLVLAHLEPEVELFEADDIGNDDDDDLLHHISQSLTALAWVLDELGSNQKHFEKPMDKISSEQLRKVEKIKPFGHSRASQKIKENATF